MSKCEDDKKKSAVGPAKFGVQFQPWPPSFEEQFRKDFPKYVDGLVIGQPGGYLSFPEYGKHAEEIYNVLPRPDDVWVMTFLKSGQ